MFVNQIAVLKEKVIGPISLLSGAKCIYRGSFRACKSVLFYCRHGKIRLSHYLTDISLLSIIQ